LKKIGGGQSNKNLKYILYFICLQTELDYLSLWASQPSKNTAWAVDFETPVGSSTFFFFSFSWAALAEINNK
jgi:hypothetical protein